MLFLFVEGGAFCLIYTYMSLQVILFRVLKQKATGKQFVFWLFGNDLSQCIVKGFFLVSSAATSAGNMWRRHVADCVPLVTIFFCTFW